MTKKLGILEKVKEDSELFSIWSRMSDETRLKLMEVDEGKRVPDLLCDTIFKGIFNPDVNKDRLSRFISCIIGRKVKVLHSLDKEGYCLSVHSKGIILDLLVQFEDGAIGNVEIQRQGVYFPPQRAAVYSSNLITRQYAVGKEEQKSNINFLHVKPVYTIVIMEKSAGELKKSDAYIHHFKQRSDAGAELELLQYYDYVCLDKFREKRPQLAGELERWLRFLSIENVQEMEKFLNENQDFQSVYDYAILMLSDREEMLEMFTDLFESEDIVASLNKTYEAMSEDLQKELQEKQNELEEKWEQLQEKQTQLEEKKIQLEEKNTQLQEKQTQLEEKKMQLEEKNTQLQEKQTQLEEKEKQLQEKDAEIQHLQRLLQKK